MLSLITSELLKSNLEEQQKEIEHLSDKQATLVKQLTDAQQQVDKLNTNQQYREECGMKMLSLIACFVSIHMDLLSLISPAELLKAKLEEQVKQGEQQAALVQRLTAQQQLDKENTNTQHREECGMKMLSLIALVLLKSKLEEQQKEIAQLSDKQATLLKELVEAQQLLLQKPVVQEEIEAPLPSPKVEPPPPPPKRLKTASPYLSSLFVNAQARYAMKTSKKKTVEPKMREYNDVFLIED